MSTLTFNGTDLADFGVHISGEGTFNAPTRAVEEQIVPGRNGTLIIDGGRWENIIVTYPAYITDDFADNMADLRNFLASVRGYARLADTYHPNEFRLACFSDEITVRTSGRYNAQGQFDLSFNCKPQRFLTSGEEVTTFDASDLPSESFSGNPATFETDGEYKVSELSVGITPVQSGSGDPSPDNIRPISGRTGLTVTRAGKNVLNNTAQTVTQSGVTFTVNDDKTVTTSGTSTKNANYIVLGVQTLPAGDYVLSGCPSGGSASSYYIRINRGATASGAAGVRVATDIGSGVAFTLTEATQICTWMSCDNGQVMDGKTFTPMIRAAGASDTYEKPTSTEYPISWQTQAGTIYGGTLDVVSGVLTVDTILATVTAFVAENANWSNDSTIAVSSGSALAEPRDSAKRARAVTNMLPNAMGYGIDTAVGSQYTTTPCFGFNANDTYNRYLYARFPKTIGTTLAEVNAYLAENPLVLTYAIQTPQTYQLTPTEVRTILGGNTIFTDAGGVDGKYLLPLRITNPTAFEAKPIIRIYGAGTVGIGDVNVTFDGSSEYVDLDCEIQDAYYGLANKNSAVTLNPNRFPVIPASGAEIVLGSGITQVDITPRWFEL